MLFDIIGGLLLALVGMYIGCLFGVLLAYNDYLRIFERWHQKRVRERQIAAFFKKMSRY